tara:strand:- start:12491 stop:12994 length:504 start_codon:yes stop_codon:yes gene_type:complete
MLTNNTFMGLDKIFILIIFLGMSIFDNLKYLYHIVGVLSIYIINLFVVNIDVNMTSLFFSVIFGIINIYRYNYDNVLYNFMIVFIGVILFKYIMMNILNLPFVFISAVCGAVFALLYIIILRLLGFTNGKSKNDDGDNDNSDSTNTSDNDKSICVEYDKNNNFVKYV